MEQEQIDKMFEGRWRIKVGQPNLTIGWLKGVKELVKDFFQAGILLAEGNTETDASFEAFWNLYEKKVAMQKCLKLWNKLTPKEKADCMAYIPKYKIAQPDKQYRKNPETFLRNKSFYDELIYRDTTQQRFDKLADILTD